MAAKQVLLNSDQILKKIQRICFEIIEKNYESNELIILGIEKRGFLLAEIIFRELKKITDKHMVLGKIKPVSLSNNTFEIEVSKELKNSVIIVIDDVLNTGKTLMYGVQAVLKHDVKKLMTLVLVDRKHGLFPIKADISGLRLSTTLQDHVEVEFTQNSIQAFIS